MHWACIATEAGDMWTGKSGGYGTESQKGIYLYREWCEETHSRTEIVASTVTKYELMLAMQGVHAWWQKQRAEGRIEREERRRNRTREGAYKKWERMN